MKLPIASRRGLDARVRELTETRAELASLVQASLASAAAADAKYAAILGDRDRLHAAVARAESEAGRLAEQVVQADQRIASLLATVADWTQRHAASQGAREELVRRIEDTHSRLTESDRRLRAAAEQQAVFKTQIGQLTSGLEAAREEGARALQEAEEQRAEIRRLAAEGMDLRRATDDATAEARRLAVRLADELEGVRARDERALQEAEEQRAEIRRLAAEGMDLRRATDDATAEARRLAVRLADELEGVRARDERALQEAEEQRAEIRRLAAASMDLRHAAKDVAVKARATEMQLEAAVMALDAARAQTCTAQAAAQVAREAAAEMRGGREQLVAYGEAARAEAGELLEAKTRLEMEKSNVEQTLGTTQVSLDHTARRLQDFQAEAERLGGESLRLESEKRLLAAQVEQAQSLMEFANRRDAILALRSSGARTRLANALGTSPQGIPDRKAIFALHKTASMFVWRLLDFLSDVLGVSLHSPNGTNSEYLLDEINIRGREFEVLRHFGLFGPFRGFVDLDWSLFTRLTVITRDPRDLLVSMYFSWSRSHPIDANKPSLISPQGSLFNPSDAQRTQWIEEGPDNFVLEYAVLLKAIFVLFLSGYFQTLVPHFCFTKIWCENLIFGSRAF